MPSLDFYKQILGNKTIGQVHKYESDMIMNDTWDRDIQSKIAYIYDFYHDDEPFVLKGLRPQLSEYKIPVDIKFIVNAYNRENTDQVGYHIQFRPGHKCPLKYYSDIENRYLSEYPISLYLDIPDEKGIYRKWLCVENANWLGNQFPTWYVLPCDHIFQWVYDNKLYQMAGVGRSQSSYNSGVWVD